MIFRLAVRLYNCRNVLDTDGFTINIYCETFFFLKKTFWISKKCNGKNLIFWKEVDMEMVKGVSVRAAEVYYSHIHHVTDTC